MNSLHRHRLTTGLLGALVVVSFSVNLAQAASIVGGSVLLTPSQANQIETWIGTGSKTFTKIFEKKAGDTSNTFHAAADNQGPTIVVMESFSNAGAKIIGGYNSYSWDSTTGWRLTNTNDRNAFIYNLTNSILYRQKIDNSPVADCMHTGISSNLASYQTYN